MRIEIEIPESNPLLASYLIKHILRGVALGCRPLFVGPNALPPLYESGFVFKEDPNYGSGIERFRLPVEVAAAGFGDCDGLSVYELSRLLATGEDPDADISIGDYMGDGGMHAQIRRGDGSIEDPSVKLGAKADWPDWFLYDQGGELKR